VAYVLSKLIIEYAVAGDGFNCHMKYNRHDPLRYANIKDMPGVDLLILICVFIVRVPLLSTCGVIFKIVSRSYNHYVRLRSQIERELVIANHRRLE